MTQTQSLTGALSAETYSYTKLNTYEECPRRYKLRYLDDAEAEPGEALRFGKAQHQVCEGLLREHVAQERLGRLSAERAVELWREAWTEHELSGAGLFTEGVRMLRGFVASEGDVDYRRVLGIEEAFTASIGGIAVRGVIDRINRIDHETVEVVDYKTNRLINSRQEVDENLQLSVYAIAVRQLFPWVRQVRLTLHFLRHGVKISTTRTEEELAAVSEYVRVLVGQIEADHAFEARLQSSCQYCEHRKSCAAYQTALAGNVSIIASEPEDLERVAVERETVAGLAKLYGSRQRELDGILRAKLDSVESLELAGRRYRVVNTARKTFPLDRTVQSLSDASGLPANEVREQVSTVDKAQLDKLVGTLKPSLSKSRFKLLRLELDAIAEKSISPRLYSSRVREVA